MLSSRLRQGLECPLPITRLETITRKRQKSFHCSQHDTLPYCRTGVPGYVGRGTPLAPLAHFYTPVQPNHKGPNHYSGNLQDLNSTKHGWAEPHLEQCRSGNAKILRKKTGQSGWDGDREGWDEEMKEMRNVLTHFTLPHLLWGCFFPLCLKQMRR